MAPPVSIRWIRPLTIFSRSPSFCVNNGVTAWVPTLVPASAEGYERAIRAISDVIDDQKSHLPIPEARILGVHYEGPFVNNQQCGALHREYFRTFKQIEDINSLPTLQQTKQFT